MENVFIFEHDEVMTETYMIKAIGKVKIENKMDEKRLKTFMNNRTKALRQVKEKIDYEILKMNNYRPILEDK